MCDKQGAISLASFFLGVELKAMTGDYPHFCDLGVSMEYKEKLCEFIHRLPRNLQEELKIIICLKYPRYLTKDISRIPCCTSGCVSVLDFLDALYGVLVKS